MYKRYVDNIFCIFGNKEGAENFFEFLNCQHKNIKFTLGKESNREIVFQHQFIEEKKHQLGCLHSLIALHQ